MQNHAAQELHVVVPHRQKAPACFSTGGKRFDQQIVEGFTRGKPFAKLIGLASQLFVGQRLVGRLQGRDRGHLGLGLLEIACVGRAKQRRNGTLETAQNAVTEPAQDFPNSFQYFHRSLKKTLLTKKVASNPCWSKSPTIGFPAGSCLYLSTKSQKDDVPRTPAPEGELRQFT